MRRFFFPILVTLVILLSVNQGYSDETDLFRASYDPDIVILFDLSGSMRWTPTGATMYVATGQTCAASNIAHYANSDPLHTKVCNIDPYGTVPKYSDATCAGPFYTNSSGTHTMDCSRLAIAKRALFDLLDDNDNNSVNDDDAATLKIRFGYMNFYNCSADDTGGNYSSGCIKLIRALPARYSDIWSSVNSAAASGGTPLSSSLNEARLYLDASKSGDPYANCRMRFVLLITDGADTYACSGSGSEDQTTQYKRRRESVKKALELFNAGYNLYVIGFGANMPHYLRNTLNWMAYYGGTSNQDEESQGEVDDYIPGSVTTCQTSTTASHNLGDGSHYYGTSNDPGEAFLSGYAFFATNPDELTNNLKAVIRRILQQVLSMTIPTTPSVRMVAEENVYISYFMPNSTAFWKGNLKAYRLNADGTIPIDENGWPLISRNIWDPVNNAGVGEILSTTLPANRNILTYVNSSQKTFINGNVRDVDLALSTSTNCSGECDKLIKYVRGEDKYNVRPEEDDTWKLGDIFHSNSVVVGAPSAFFEDEGYSGTGGFYDLKKNRTRVVIVGGNDGMLHAFEVATGQEKWGFVPNGLLKTLKNWRTAHSYFVDSTAKVSDVWFYSSDTDTTKSASEWRTILMVGYRKGGNQYMALDITDTLNPVYLWEFPRSTDTTTLNKVGQSWSEPVIGRVKVEIGGSLYERWVAFIGGGYEAADLKGKCFFVLDIKTGTVIKEFSGLSAMTKSFPASPIALDIDGDGYVDKVYIGDFGGQMWVFDVSFNAITNKSNSLWSGKVLFAAPGGGSEKHKIYGAPAVTLDDNRKPWAFFGTGDREDPKNTSGIQERFYAVRDDGIGTYPRTENDLSNVTSNNTYTKDPLKMGWYIKLEKGPNNSEKVWERPVVFNQLLYFSSYTYATSGNPCEIEGFGTLYCLEFQSGGGAWAVTKLSDLSGTPSDRSIPLTSGAPSNPVISVSLSGQATINTSVMGGRINSRQIFSPPQSKSVVYWREIIR